MRLIALSLAAAAIAAGCSPLKSSPREEKHQLELTLLEMQTNLDDLRHEISCCKTDLQILDSRLKNQETLIAALKQQGGEKNQTKLDSLSQQLSALEKRIAFSETKSQGQGEDLKRMSIHANETTSALAQFKDRLCEFEQELLSQQRHFEEVAKLKGHFEGLAKHLRGSPLEKLYKVRAGDSLEKIARLHKTTVERLKQANGLTDDRIAVGKELRIPDGDSSQ